MPEGLLCLRCVWFELELAASYLRTGDYGRALKNFTHVEQHFADIGEDQFDFHTYCVRKMTLRESVEITPSPAGRCEERLRLTSSCEQVRGRVLRDSCEQRLFTPAAVNRYVKMVRFEDTLHGHAFLTSNLLKKWYSPRGTRNFRTMPGPGVVSVKSKRGAAIVSSSSSPSSIDTKLATRGVASLVTWGDVAGDEQYAESVRH